MIMRIRASLVLAACALVASTAALAHPPGTGGLLQGFAHPFSGLDHLLAMLIVGLWAARRRGATRLLLPVAFVLSLLLGALLGLADVLLTATDASVTPVPGTDYTFSTLKQAQALGDFEALAANGRDVVHYHLDDPRADFGDTLETLLGKLDAAD